MRGPAILAVAAILAQVALPAAAQPPPGLVPVQVAIDALPSAVRTAIREAQHQLLADTARKLLEDTAAYVQGFQQLPAGRSALADPQVQEAYAWAEEAVETLLAVPARLESAESAGAFCASHGVAGGAEEGRRAVEGGMEAIRVLEAVQGAVAGLRERAPRGLGLDLAPFDAAAAELEGWRLGRGVEVQACLEELARLLGLLQPPADLLTAFLVPGTTWRTGTFRVLGSWPAGNVTVRAPTLGLDRTLAARPGFQAQAEVPRSAALGSHAILVAAGGQEVELGLKVILAPSTLTLHAPGTVRPGEPFHARVTVSSPAGLAEADAGPLMLEWNGTVRPLQLGGGAAVARLDAGPARGATLSARYAGTEVVAPAQAALDIRVAAPLPPVPDAPPSSPPAPLVRVAEAASLLLLWLLLAAAGILAWRLWRRRPRPVPPALPPGPRWPGAAGYAAAVGILFALLRKLRLVPPGRTVQEWARAGHAPAEVADAFDKVRYGGRPEGASLRTRGVAWIRRRWERP